MSHQCTVEAFCFLSKKNVFVLYTLTSINISFGVFFYDQAKNISEIVWTPCLRPDIFDVRFLLAVDCSAFGVKVKA